MSDIALMSVWRAVSSKRYAICLPCVLRNRHCQVFIVRADASTTVGKGSRGSSVSESLTITSAQTSFRTGTGTSSGAARRMTSKRSVRRPHPQRELEVLASGRREQQRVHVDPPGRGLSNGPFQ